MSDRPTKTINVDGENFGGVDIRQTSVEPITVDSDVQAGIEFIYHMREHIVDVTIATAYLLLVYAIYMWIKKKLS
jgi:hypothetical protein